ncbi:PA2778 family cysteine peptidase [Mariprofundus sp. KV]|nr:PA2778 family cysteine peptidase [Mariprofundus sp. KV]
MAGVCLITLLAGCTAKQSAALLEAKPAEITAASQLEGVPFFPQLDYQCGPASLAMAMNFAGVEVAPDALRRQLFIPGKQGSLQVEMQALPRHFGLLAYPLAPRLVDIFKEIKAGHPVIVLQNLGLKIAPQWHYAVVTGYDLNMQQVTLHSGDAPNYRMPLSTFERTWVRGGSWAIVVSAAGSVPAGAREQSYLRSAVNLEQEGKADAALKAYEAAAKRWPDSLAAWMGLGNMRYARMDLDGAAAAFSHAAKIHPNAAEQLNNLAQVRLEQGQYDAAMQIIEQAVQLDGDAQLYQQTRSEVLRIRAAELKRKLPSSANAAVDNKRMNQDNALL